VCITLVAAVFDPRPRLSPLELAQPCRVNPIMMPPALPDPSAPTTCPRCFSVFVRTTTDLRCFCLQSPPTSLSLSKWTRTSSSSSRPPPVSSSSMQLSSAEADHQVSSPSILSSLPIGSRLSSSSVGIGVHPVTAPTPPPYLSVAQPDWMRRWIGPLPWSVLTRLPAFQLSPRSVSLARLTFHDGNWINIRRRWMGTVKVFRKHLLSDERCWPVL